MLKLNVDELAVTSFPVNEGIQSVRYDDPGDSDFTLCTACPTNEFSCLATCKFTCAGGACPITA